MHPHSSHCEKAEEGGVGRGTKSFRRWKLRCAAEQARYLFVAINVRRLSLIPMRKKPGSRDLCSRFLRTVPRGETPDHTQTPSPRVRLSVRGLGRPAERQLPRDVGGAFNVEERDKVSQTASHLPEFEPKSAANRDVFVQCQIERVHRPPPTLGQGCASVRRPSKSSLA